MFFDEDFHNFFIANLAKQSIQSDYRRIFLLLLASPFLIWQKKFVHLFFCFISLAYGTYILHKTQMCNSVESRKGVNCKEAEGNNSLYFKMAKLFSDCNKFQHILISTLLCYPNYSSSIVVRLVLVPIFCFTELMFGK